jgi:MFS family permease
MLRGFGTRRGFVPLLASLFLVDLGSAMVAIAVPLLLVRDYGLSFAVGVTFALGVLPRVVATPFLGSLLVRHDPRRIAVGSALAAAPVTALIPLAHALWEFQVLNLVVSMLGAIAAPSRLALRASTIAEGEELRGNSLFVAAGRVPSVLGPAMVGILQAAGLGLGPVFLVPSGCAAIAAVLVLWVPARPAAAEPEADADVVEGSAKSRYLRHVVRNTRTLIDAASGDRFIAGLTLTSFFYTCAMGVERVLLLALVHDRFAGAPDTYGWLLGAMALGAVSGALLGGRLGRFGHGTLYVVGNLAEALVWVALIVVHHRPEALVLMLLAGVLEAVATVVFFAEVQRRVAPTLIGYYYAAILPLMDATFLLGYLAGGILAHAGVSAMAWASGALIALPILATVGWYRTPAPAVAEVVMEAAV